MHYGLGQRPPPELLDADRNEILHWAVANWDISAVGKVSRAHDPATVHSP